VLAIPGGQHLFEYQGANRVFLGRQSVAPLAGRIRLRAHALVGACVAIGLMLSPDTDKIEALQSRSGRAMGSRPQGAISQHQQKRIATGYGPVEGGDVFQSSSQ